MANERLYQFPSKASPVPADIIYGGDSAAAFDEVNMTIAQLVSAYPNLSGIAGLTLGANTFPYSNSSAAITAGSITALAVSLLADTTIASMQSTLGVTPAPTASQFAGWDANKNLAANNFLSGYATTVTAAATTTLVVGSAFQQFFTGSTTQTVLLPVTSTLSLGLPFYIVNNSSGAVTVQSSGGNTIQVMASNTTLLVTCILLTGTTAASWYADYNFQTALALPLSLANGGTNASLTASNGGIFYSTGSAGAILSGTATASQLLLSGASGAPSWSTSTYPATNAANTLLYASSANVMAALATVNSAGLLTNGSGVPGWVAYTGTGAPVLANTPTLITPVLGAATATSINFGGTTLANYVQGTFTPVLVSSGGGTATYSSQFGTYTRIGNRVFFNITIIISANTFGAGTLSVTGLPLTPAGTTNYPVTMYCSGMAATAVTWIEALLVPSNATIFISKYSAGATTALPVSDLTNSSQIEISGQINV